MWIKKPTPVMINSIMELSGSTRKDNGIFKLPAEIQSKRNISCDFWVSEPKARKIPMLIKKGTKIAALPITPISPLENVFLPSPLIKKPISGINGTSQTKSIIL